MPLDCNQFDLSGIQTVADFQTYLTTFPSPMAAQLIQDAIRFFLTPCNQEDKRERRKAMKERKHMGMSRKLEECDSLTPEICRALMNHTVHPLYGRKAADSSMLLFAARMGDDSPVSTANEVLRKIANL